MGGAVVVVGSVNVDLVVRVRGLPAPGETVTGGSFHRAPGGKGGNAAVASARLGAPTRIVGLIGPDDLGEEARRDLEGAGVDVAWLGTGAEPTGVAAILVDAGGRNLIAVASGANAEVTASQVHEALSGIEAERAVVLSNLEIPDAAVAAAAEAARRRGWPFVLNPAPARALPPGLLGLCTAVVPNEREAEALGSPDEMLAAGAGAVIVTRGSSGADLHRPGRPVHRQASFPVEVVDTTGAGDAFVATVAWALLEGRPLETAVELAAAAGALACRALGARAGLAGRAELERLVGS